MFWQSIYQMKKSTYSRRIPIVQVVYDPLNQNFRRRKPLSSFNTFGKRLAIVLYIAFLP